MLELLMLCGAIVVAFAFLLAICALSIAAVNAADPIIASAASAGAGLVVALLAGTLLCMLGGCGDASATEEWQGLHVGRVAEGFEIDNHAGVGGLDEAVLAASASYGIDTDYLLVTVDTLERMHAACSYTDDVMPGCTYFVGGNAYVTGAWDDALDPLHRAHAIAHQLNHAWQYQLTGDPDFAHAKADWGQPVLQSAITLRDTLDAWQCEHNEVCNGN